MTSITKAAWCLFVCVCVCVCVCVSRAQEKTHRDCCANGICPRDGEEQRGIEAIRDEHEHADDHTQLVANPTGTHINRTPGVMLWKPARHETNAHLPGGKG